MNCLLEIFPTKFSIHCLYYRKFCILKFAVVTFILPRISALKFLIVTFIIPEICVFKFSVIYFILPKTLNFKKRIVPEISGTNEISGSLNQLMTFTEFSNLGMRLTPNKIKFWVLKNNYRKL